jgi:hypothetical protein
MTKLVKNVFNWEYFLCYLCGPIDFDPEGGSQWRIDWTKGLIDIGFNSKQILSPTKKPITGTAFDLDNEADLIHDCRSREDWDGLEAVMSDIMHIDLRLVDKSDLILVRFPLDKNGNRVFTVGTIHEIIVARQQHKPVLVVWDGGGKKTCSGWLMKLVGHQNIFADFTELQNHLKQVSSGVAAINAKDWLLLDLDKNYQERRIRSKNKERLVRYGSNPSGVFGA